MKLSDITGTWKHLVYRFKLQPSKTDLDHQASNWHLWMSHCPMGHQNPPSEHVGCHFLNIHLMKKTSLVAPAQKDCYFIFFSSPISLHHTFHTSGNCVSLSHKYPKSLDFREMDLRLFLLSHHLTALWINLFCVANTGILAVGLLYVEQANLNQYQYPVCILSLC